jgi:hypothetical protein
MNFEIGKLHPNTPHLFSDLAELILITGYNGRRSIHKNDLETVIETGIISAEELDEESEALVRSEALGESGAEKNNRRERQLEDVLTHLDFRSKALQEFYPFEVDGETIRIVDRLNNKQRVYKLLLACSRLRSFLEEGIDQSWAKAFTEVCKIGMMGLVPSSATVKIFDANSDDRRTYYSTNLSEALKVLGKDLAVKIDEDECDNAGTSGDAGFDLIAIVNFEDGAYTNYALLGQCGAQEKDWPSKTLEAHSFKLRTYYKVLFDCPGFMFTPICYRTSDASWRHTKAAAGIVLIDRIRILKLIEMQNRWDEIVASAWFIEFEEKLSTVIAPE